MSNQKQNQNVEIIGLGVQSPTPIQAPPERVWEVMIDKIYNIGKYAPVTNVKTKDIKPGQHMHRVLTFNGKLIEEDIYFDKTHYEIRADVVGEDETHINRYYPDRGILEYWQENGKGERIPWDVPRAIALAAMEKVKELAEASK